ncbi:hypothetical protein C8R45DRAFT_1130562 [Mycena sanguinolenta]|nr:hypothetical protein C8R45DRAFT_1130562 [Mycena sanguinolenta]
MADTTQDWWATHSTLAINKGLDMTMPGDVSANSGNSYFGTNLATRILAAWYLAQDGGVEPPISLASYALWTPSNRDLLPMGPLSSSTSDTDLTGAKTAATGKDVAFVFITADSGEMYITVEGNAGATVFLHGTTGTPWLLQLRPPIRTQSINVEAWITNANSKSFSPLILTEMKYFSVTAVVRTKHVWSGVPGHKKLVTRLVDILYGAYNPSGRLPYTIGKSVTDCSAQVIFNQAGSITPIPYTEGIFIDYRHFDQVSI